MTIALIVMAPFAFVGACVVVGIIKMEFDLRRRGTPSWRLWK